MSNLIKFDKEELKIIKDLFFKNSTDAEFSLFIHACKKTGLNPLLRQIHAIKRYSTTLGREVMTIQTGIDGYRLIAERTGRYAPGREPTYTYNENGQLLSATAYVKKMTDDKTWHEVAATAFFREYCQYDKKGNVSSFWAKMGHCQLSKCAEALALRRAFPGDLSGLYTKEEMDQASDEDLEEDEKLLAESYKDSPPLIENQKEETISKDQVNALRDLIGDDKEYLKKLYAHYKINSLEELLVKKYKFVLESAFRNYEEKRKNLLEVG